MTINYFNFYLFKIKNIKKISYKYITKVKIFYK